MELLLTFDFLEAAHSYTLRVSSITSEGKVGTICKNRSSSFRSPHIEHTDVVSHATSCACRGQLPDLFSVVLMEPLFYYGKSRRRLSQM